MKTTRFETFFDAVLAIIITILVMKIAQPAAPSLEAVGELINSYLTYLLCFLIIFNMWHGNNNLFQIIEEIDTKTLICYGLLIFSISLLPYFSIWLSLNIYSIPAQTMFGINALMTYFFYFLSITALIKANPKNTDLKKYSFINKNLLLLILPILVGFLLTYTIFTPGIYWGCIISIIYSTVTNGSFKNEIINSERFEAFIDAIVAIVLTIIVLELTMAHGGNWEALFDLKLEFIVYIVSFIVCFNYWLFNNNLFHLVEKVNYKVIWTIGISLFIFSLIPYFTKFVASNFYSFVPQALYGVDFMMIMLIGAILEKYLKESDPDNKNLHQAFDKKTYLVLVVLLIGFIIGYIYWPPAIIVTCLISIPLSWILGNFRF